VNAAPVCCWIPGSACGTLQLYHTARLKRVRRCAWRCIASRVGRHTGDSCEHCVCACGNRLRLYIRVLNDNTPAIPSNMMSNAQLSCASLPTSSHRAGLGPEPRSMPQSSMFSSERLLPDEFADRTRSGQATTTTAQHADSSALRHHASKHRRYTTNLISFVTTVLMAFAHQSQAQRTTQAQNTNGPHDCQCHFTFYTTPHRRVHSTRYSTDESVGSDYLTVFNVPTLPCTQLPCTEFTPTGLTAAQCDSEHHNMYADTTENHVTLTSSPEHVYKLPRDLGICLAAPASARALAKPVPGVKHPWADHTAFCKDLDTS
jgi:hypothetical protein